MSTPPPAPALSLRRLDSTLSVAGQITETDLPAIAAAGFSTLICNRPDGEDPGQPGHLAIAEAAERHGLGFAFLPVVGGGIGAAEARAFAALLAAAPGPVLAYCRSGQRCTVLWAFSQADRQPWETLVQTAAQAGYDLAQLRPPTGP